MVMRQPRHQVGSPGFPGFPGFPISGPFIPNPPGFGGGQAPAPFDPTFPFFPTDGTGSGKVRTNDPSGTDNGDGDGDGGFGGLFPGILEAEPELPFFSALNQQTGLSPNQRQFFEGSFDRIFNIFTGLLGESIQGGNDPAGFPTFSDFIQDFDFERDFLSRAPSQRPGSSTARFRPPTQFRF